MAGKVAPDGVWATIDEIVRTNKEMQVAVKELQAAHAETESAFKDADG
ncbi:MAG: hypothetical protein LBK73_13080 [Treponema sp.]|nr:hypothetical protein [Treponema sp.]